MSYKQRKSPCILLARRIYRTADFKKIAQITEVKANLNPDSLYLKVNCYLSIDITNLNLLLNRKKGSKSNNMRLAEIEIYFLK